eukprot:6028325-Amphidinium_carterae.1
MWNAVEGFASCCLLEGDDLRRTPPSSLEWIQQIDQNVGLTGLAHKSKTGPAAGCAVLGASPAGDGPSLMPVCKPLWTFSCLHMVTNGARMITWYIRSLFIHNVDTTWASSPVVLSKGIIYLRELESLVHHDFAAQVAAQVRTHGAKEATLPSLGLYLRLNLPAIHMQGGWAAPSSEQMPDRYTRDE